MTASASCCASRIRAWYSSSNRSASARDVSACSSWSSTNCSRLFMTDWMGCQRNLYKKSIMISTLMDWKSQVQKSNVNGWLCAWANTVSSIRAFPLRPIRRSGCADEERGRAPFLHPSYVLQRRAHSRPTPSPRPTGSFASVHVRLSPQQDGDNEGEKRQGLHERQGDQQGRAHVTRSLRLTGHGLHRLGRGPRLAQRRGDRRQRRDRRGHGEKSGDMSFVIPSFPPAPVTRVSRNAFALIEFTPPSVTGRQ